MQPYHLAKLIQWAPSGLLKSRKRMQKVVYLLKSAGCAALDAEFTLHHYGPYSQEVAALTDQMVSAGLLQETQEPNSFGFSYSYSLSERTEKLLKVFEASDTGKRLVGELQQFKTTAKELIVEDLPKLEYASTVAYFYRLMPDWEKARREACKFKKLDEKGDSIGAAVNLARKLIKFP